MNAEESKSDEYWTKNAPGLVNTGKSLDSVIDDFSEKFGLIKEPTSTSKVEGGEEAEQKQDKEIVDN